MRTCATCDFKVKDGCVSHNCHNCWNNPNNQIAKTITATI